MYKDVNDMTAIFKGQGIGGIASTVYKFTAPTTPGNYFFCDDLHRTEITGQLKVEQ